MRGRISSQNNTLFYWHNRRATSLPTLVQMVASGLGVTFLPRMAVNAGLAVDARLAIRTIKAENPAREIVVAWRAGSNRRAEGRLLAEVLKEV